MKTYEVWGDGIETSIIARGRIINGDSPKDALNRARIIHIKRRLTNNDKTPPRWIAVRCVEIDENGFIRYAPNHPTNYYEV